MDSLPVPVVLLTRRCNECCFTLGSLLVSLLAVPSLKPGRSILANRRIQMMVIVNRLDIALVAGGFGGMRYELECKRTPLPKRVRDPNKYGCRNFLSGLQENTIRIIG